MAFRDLVTTREFLRFAFLLNKIKLEAFLGNLFPRKNTKYQGTESDFTQNKSIYIKVFNFELFLFRADFFRDKIVL